MGDLTATETMDQKHQEDLVRLRKLRLMDDAFFTKCFDGETACVKLVLQIILDKPEYEFWRDLRPPKPSAEKEEN